MPRYRDAARPADDEEWVQRIRAGDESAFEHLFRAHYANLCSFAESLLSSGAAAEDAVEEVFLGIWRMRDRWVVRGGLKAYLYSAVRNQAIKQLDHRRVVKRSEPAVARIAQARWLGQASDQADASVEAAELLAALGRAVEALPDRRRQVFELSRDHGLSHAQIAEVMGVSTKTVENHLTLALKALRESLSAFLP